MDIYGKIRKLEGAIDFVPFRYQGQYEDIESGLYYNRFRYYDCISGNYISQDPIGLMGNNPNFYGYVSDVNLFIDQLGLNSSLPQEVIILAEKNMTSSGQTVLGHFPEYIEKAKKINASYYDIGDAWNDLSIEHRWGANKHFLDKITERGDYILLSHSKMNIRKGSYLEQEINTLISEKNYKWVNQWALKKICK